MGRSIKQLGFVIYGGGICLFDATVRDINISCTVASNRQIPLGFSLMGRSIKQFGFVIYGEKICCLWGVSPFWQLPPTFDKPQSSSVGSQNYKKISNNERPGKWSCDGFLTNHKALFQDFESVKGLPLQKFFISVCHIWGWGLSVLTNPTHLWQTPSLHSG